MKFELNEYHRNISKSDMINDLIRVANELDTPTLSKKQYNSIGKYSADTIAKHFNGWSNAILECGLVPLKISIKKRYNKIDEESLLLDLKNVAEMLKVDTITSTDYQLYGKYDRNSFTAKFGSWENALKCANLHSTGFHRDITNDELFSNIESIWLKLGKQPSCNDMKSGLSKYGIKTYYRRFGSWNNALRCFIDYINGDDKSQLSTDNALPTILPKNAEEVFIHSSQREINLRLRFLVMKRDNFKCCACGASPAKDPSIELHIDHIIPWSKGGETTIDNLQTLCSKCNLGKSDLL